MGCAMGQDTDGVCRNEGVIAESRFRGQNSKKPGPNNVTQKIMPLTLPGETGDGRVLINMGEKKRKKCALPLQRVTSPCYFCTGLPRGTMLHANEQLKEKRDVK